MASNNGSLMLANIPRLKELMSRDKLDAVIATVDAQHGLRGPESLRQVAAADVLVVTKVDLADPRAVTAELRGLNPLAEVIHAVDGDVAVDDLFGRGHAPPSSPLPHRAHIHEDDVRSVSVALDGELDWLGFGVWLTMLLHARGQEILRVKGLLDVGEDGPLLVNAVQHVVHPAEHLVGWPDEDRRSRLVLIGRGFDADGLERSLRAFAAPQPGVATASAASSTTVASATATRSAGSSSSVASVRPEPQ